MLAHELTHTIQQGAIRNPLLSKRNLVKGESVQTGVVQGQTKISAGGIHKVQRQSGLPNASQMVQCPNNELTAAITTARTWATQSYPVITSLTAKVQAGNINNLTSREQYARQELLNMFQIEISNPAHVNHLLYVMNIATFLHSIMRTLNPNDFRCVTQQYSECGPFWQAEAFVTGRLPVYLCITAFQSQTAPGRAHTVLHEVAHVAGAMGHPEIYSPICSPYVLGAASTLDALENADHYACLLRVLRL